ncbi:hypothetical protein [Sporosarcina koreensis]|uniref:Immunity protein 50 n=1 Tax=Sporosarcina koreensis TaxID=334735 RepID=A0ABW0TZF8_9BACL
MKFYLLGEETKVEIDVLYRSYPNSSDYWDANWVNATIKIEIPGYKVSFDADLRTDEIRKFLNELKSLRQSLRGKASLTNLEGNLEFEGEIDKLGKIKWNAETCYPAGNGAVLEFKFESDQTYLNMLIKELDDIITHFPVIGKP